MVGTIKVRKVSTTPRQPLNQHFVRATRQSFAAVRVRIPTFPIGFWAHIFDPSTLRVGALDNSKAENKIFRPSA